VGVQISFIYQSFFQHDTSGGNGDIKCTTSYQSSTYVYLKLSKCRHSKYIKKKKDEKIKYIVLI